MDKRLINNATFITNNRKFVQAELAKEDKELCDIKRDNGVLDTIVIHKVSDLRK